MLAITEVRLVMWIGPLLVVGNPDKVGPVDSDVDGDDDGSLLDSSDRDCDRAELGPPDGELDGDVLGSRDIELDAPHAFADVIAM